ncbi:MAG: tetratricopeptide repeat protein [Planctomycetes bacterium]|nr:tetratricopeptide repeat protein [Planctomycetota bacterium]
MTQPGTAREEAQRRFKAAWNDSLSGGNPPDLDSFLAPFEEPERSVVRAELLELDHLFRRRSSDAVVAGPGTWTAPQPDPRPPAAAAPRTRLTRLARIFALSLVLSLIGLGGWLITIHFLAEYHLRQARRALDHQRYPETLEHLNKANGLRPGSAEIHMRLARIHRLLGAFPKADEHLNRYKELQGQTEEGQLERLMLRAQTGEVEKVFPLLWRYVEKKRPEAPVVLQALSYGFIEQELNGPAQKCLEKWLELDPDNIQALVIEAWLKDRNGAGTPEARENYLRALDLDPSRADIRLRLAHAYLGQQRDRDAIEAYKQVLRQEPDNAPAQLGLAQATLNFGKVKEAREMLRNFLEAHPNNATALYAMGMAAMQENKYPEAEKWLRQALKQNPNDGAAMHNLIDSLRRQGHEENSGEIPEIRRRIERVTQDHRRLDDLKRNKLAMPPFDPNVCYEVGVIYDRLGEESQAAQWFARALKSDPNHQNALRAGIKYLEKRGDKETAATLRARMGPDLPVITTSTAGLLGSPFGQGPLLAASALIAGKTKE